MTNGELREQIAARLDTVWHESLVATSEEHPEPWGPISKQLAKKLARLALADEVIRQMEWARSSYWNPEITAIDPNAFPQPSGFKIELAIHGPCQLTYAPEGWKP